MCQFRFKQFNITQQLSAMKVGTDGVLLGAWAPLSGSECRILDIGTGTGLLALMLAQRSEHYAQAPYIDAVEIESNAAAEARLNCQNSNWSERINIYNEPFQNFARCSTRSYDLIISNPPYFIADSHRDGKHAITQPARTAARHACTLSYAEIIEGAVTLLNRPRGCLTVILPNGESEVFAQQAALGGLHPTDVLMVQPTTNKPVKRIITRYAPQEEPNPPHINQLAISENGDYSDRYRELTRDFYLHF